MKLIDLFMEWLRLEAEHWRDFRYRPTQRLVFGAWGHSHNIFIINKVPEYTSFILYLLSHLLPTSLDR